MADAELAQQQTQEPAAHDLVPGRLFGRFAAAEVEIAYRREQLANDMLGVRTLIALSAAALAGFAGIDLALFGAGSAQFAALLAVRCGALAASASAFALIPRAAQRQPPAALRWLGAWAAGVAIANTYISATRPPDLSTYELVSLVLLMAYYALLPAGFLSQVLPALLVSSGLVAVVLWLNPPVDARETPVVVAMALVANVLGIVGSRSLDRVRRAQFAALQRERALHESLEQALLKTLRGTVAICAHCKQVRDEAGAWMRVEAYVRERTYAEFSHGICPTCMARHYPGAR
jgi:hypothetical protein